MKLPCVAVLAVALLGSSPALYAGKISCTNTTGRGTLAFVSTGEPGDPPVFKFVDEGNGGDPDLCLVSPSLCVTAPCLVGSTACDINSVAIGSYYDFLLSQCGGAAPAVRTLQFVSEGACP